MNADMLERLLIDQALGSLPPDTEALLAAYLAEHPAERPAGKRIGEVLAAAKAALVDNEPVRVPPFPAAKLRQRPSHPKAWRLLGKAAALAACIMLGVILHAARTASAPRSIGTTLAEHMQNAPAHEAAAQPQRPGFWSIQKYYQRAEQRRPVSRARHLGFAHAAIRRCDMKRWKGLLALASVCVVLGCVPRRVFWSPDGQYAAITGNGLYLCDAQGNLSDMISPDVAWVAWFPNSKRFLAVDVQKAPNWAAVEEMLTKQQNDAILAQAEPLRAETLAYQGDWKQFQPKAGQALSVGEFTALLMYLRDHDNGAMAKKFGDKWQEYAGLAGKICRLQVYEVAGGTARPGETVYSSVDAPGDMRISPDGKWLAMTVRMTAASPSLNRLLVMPVERDARPVAVAENVSSYPDWSPDGTSLYFGSTEYPTGSAAPSLHPLGGAAADNSALGDFALGTLSRRQIVDRSAQLLSPLPAQEDLVGLMFWEQMKVRSLRDGRILFSSCDLKLPATTADMPKHPNLYFIDPARQANVTRVLPTNLNGRVQGISLGEFDLSPDEQRLVVLGGDGGREVSIVTLATGKIETLLPAGRTKKDLASMPAWRTADELSLVLPADSPGLSDLRTLMLYKLDGNAQCISKDWPAAVLEEPSDTQPAR